MKDKKKLSKMEKYLLREFDVGMEIVTRFLNEAEYSLPCGSSPGMFLSELFQSCSNPYEADPFSIFAAEEDDLRAAHEISVLSRTEDGGGCAVSLGRHTCDVNGNHYDISGTACIQIRVKDPAVCCSLFMNAADTFAAEVFADTWDRCFMIIEAADSNRLCVPLDGFRLLSADGKRKHGTDAGLAVECVKTWHTSVNCNIVCGSSLDRIRKISGLDGSFDKCTYKPAEK